MNRAGKKALVEYFNSLVWLFLVWTILLSFSVSAQSLNPRAQAGFLEVSDWKWTKPLRLEGEWLFFPGAHLSPSEFKTHLQEDQPKTALISQSFQQIDPAFFQSNLGIATYALVISGLPEDKPFAILAPHVYTAGRVYFFDYDLLTDPTLVMEIGYPGTDEESTVGRIINLEPGYIYKSSPKMVMMVHVTNFHSLAWGGMWIAPEIGEIASIIASKSSNDKFNYFLIGLICFVAFYNLSLYVRRREDKGSLFLAILCLGFVIRAGIYVGTFDALFPLSGVLTISYKAIIMSVILLPWLGIHFLFCYFPKQFPRVSVLFWNYVVIGICAAVLLTPRPYYGHFGPPINLIGAAMMIYIYWGTFRAWRQREAGANMAAIGQIGLVVGVILELLSTWGWTAIPLNSLMYGMIFYVVFQSQIVAKRFVDAFRQSERLTYQLQREVDQQTRDIGSILDNLKQGIFTIDSSKGAIGPRFSPFLSAIIDKEVKSEMNAYDFLFSRTDLSAEQQQLITTVVDFSLNQDLLAFETNAHGLVKEAKLNLIEGTQQKDLEFDWSPILNDSELVEKILVSVRDVTEVRKLRSQAEKTQKDLVILQELIQVHEDRFFRFLAKAREHLAENMTYLAEGDLSQSVRKKLFINLHTLKGIARTYQFRTISSMIHDSEQHLSTQLHLANVSLDETLQAGHEGLQNLLNDYEAIARAKLNWSLGDQLIRLKKDQITELLPHVEALFHEALSADGQFHLAKISSRLLETCHAKLDEIIEEASRGLDSMARDLNKPCPEIVISPNQILLMDKWADRFHSVLNHILRNSLDHGIEEPSERQLKGKPDAGRISIDVHTQEGFLQLDISDDGRGLDLDKIASTAIEKGICQQTSSLTDMEIAEFIFYSGFSTKVGVTEISGRGVGMAAVRSLLESGGGSVELVLEEVPTDHRDVRFCLRISLPPEAWWQGVNLDEVG